MTASFFCICYSKLSWIIKLKTHWPHSYGDNVTEGIPTRHLCSVWAFQRAESRLAAPEQHKYISAANRWQMSARQAGHSPALSNSQTDERDLVTQWPGQISFLCLRFYFFFSFYIGILIHRVFKKTLLLLCFSHLFTKSKI